jgi:hypothetical protein
MQRVSNHDLEQAGFSEEKTKMFINIAAMMFFPINKYHRTEYIKSHLSFDEGVRQYYLSSRTIDGVCKSIYEGWLAARLYGNLLTTIVSNDVKGSIRFISWISRDKGAGGEERLRKIMRKYRSVFHFWITYVSAREDGLFYPCYYDTRNSKEYFIDHFGEFLSIANSLRGFYIDSGLIKTDKRGVWMPPGWEKFEVKTNPLRITRINEKLVQQCRTTLEEEWHNYLENKAYLSGLKKV